MNRTNYTACESGNGLLCEPDGATPLISTNGATIPDLSQGGAVLVGENDLETIHAVGLGGTLQTTYTGTLFDHENNFVLGGSIDHSTVDFQSSAEIGLINPSLQILGSGLFVDTPENTGFNATQSKRDQQLLWHLYHRYL
jgi:iron complex outermembrane receptor protein